jgi:hypothetical protein
LSELIVENENGEYEVDFSKIEIKHDKVVDYEFYLEDGIFTTKVGKHEFDKP